MTDSVSVDSYRVEEGQASVGGCFLGSANLRLIVIAIF